MLSNRELASAIWLGAFVLWVFAYRSTRGAAWGVVRAFCRTPILDLLAIAGLYIWACVSILAWTNLWTFANLKTTLLWAFSFAFLSMMNASKIDEDAAYFRKAVRETLTLTVLISFLADSFTFSLTTELVLVPLLAFVTVMQVVAQSKPEHSPVSRLMTGILITVGTIYILHAGYEAVLHFRDFATLDTARDFIVPILLSLLFLPFLFALNIYRVYELVFLGIEWGINDKRLRRYAKRRAMLAFGPNLGFLKRWRRIVLQERPTDRLGIARTFAELRVVRRHERHPPKISKEEGWSPYKAKEFLASEGFITEDYYRTYDTWRAGSRMEKIGKPYSLNTITYYVDGNARAATELTLEMNIFDTSDEGVEDADKRFGSLCGKLLSAAIGMECAHSVAGMLDGDAEDTFDVAVDGYRIQLKKDEWTLTKRSGYERTFVISR